MNPFVYLTLFLPVVFTPGAIGASQFRTDINPALRYYQAFLEMPNLSESDHQFLFFPDWRGKQLDARFGDLLSRYDVEFRFLREAAGAKVNCDWGIDLTQGPDSLLPGLARAKASVQATRLRVMWQLQNGRQAAARDDLLAAHVLARNVSRGGVLISVLVELAMENVVDSIVAENFFQWQPETLRQIAAGFDAAPAVGTVAQCVSFEKQSFHDWLLHKVREIQQDGKNDPAETANRLSQLLARIIGDPDPDTEFAAQVVKAGAGTIEGVARLVEELAPLYDKISLLMSLPHGPFEEQMAVFMTEVEKNPNPLVRRLFTVFSKCRTKEFAGQVKQAMIRAGIEYKLNGEAGLKRVLDPCGTGPFSVRRFKFAGEDRGFELRSTYNGRGHEEVLIFVEKNGPAFLIDGKNAGTPAR